MPVAMQLVFPHSFVPTFAIPSFSTRPLSLLLDTIPSLPTHPRRDVYEIYTHLSSSMHTVCAIDGPGLSTNCRRAKQSRGGRAIIRRGRHDLDRDDCSMHNRRSGRGHRSLFGRTLCGCEKASMGNARGHPSFRATCHPSYQDAFDSPIPSITSGSKARGTTQP